MGWTSSVVGAVLALTVCLVVAKPGGHVTEERRAYYQKTSQVIESPIIFPTNGELQAYTATNNGGEAYSTWAQSHMDAVKQMADRLRSEYNLQARGGAGGRKGYHRLHHGFSRGSAFDYPNFTGKSKEEMDAIARQMTEQMISDMKSGKILYSEIAQPNWFENLAAQKLESLSQTQDVSSQQQTQSSGFHQGGQDAFVVEGFRQTPQAFGGGYTRTSEKKHYEYSSSHGGYQPVLPTFATEIEDLTRRQEQSSVVYPTTITIIGGNRFVDKKNCTTSASNIAIHTPYVSSSRGHSSSIDEILEKGRTIPIVVDQSHSTYNKEVSSLDKQHGPSVPVYQGSYFSGDQFDSQFSQSNTQSIPVQSQIQSETSETRGKSRYNSGYEPIMFDRGGETVRQSSTLVRERESQQTPVVIPTQQTISSSADTYRESQSKQYVPVVFPSSSTQQESSISNYESRQEHRPAPRPVTTTSSHSIYKHLQKESEIIPDYKPVVTIDSQTIESTNQELNNYYQQRPTTFIQAQESEHVEQERAKQESGIIPEFTLTIHQQETEEGSKDLSTHQVRPTIATSQQTYTDDRQQSSVQYRPSYPAYGNQISRNDTGYERNYLSQFPQQTTTGSTYEKHEQEHYKTSEHQQTKPVYTQSSQSTEEINTSSSHREYQAPVIAGESTDYQESHEDQYTRDYQRPLPEKMQTEEVNQTTHISTHRGQQPLYVSGSNSQTIETDDQLRQSTRYRPYPTGHQHISTETEGSYWLQHQSVPESTVSSQSDTESIYRESGRTRYPQSGLMTSKSSQEQELEQQDVRFRPGQPGFSVTTQLNDTAVSSSKEGVLEMQQPFVTIAQQQTVVDESGSDQGSQIVIQPGYGEKSVEMNQSSIEAHDTSAQYPVGSDRTRDQASYDLERQRQQQVYGGGLQLDRTEYGSQVNRNFSSGGASIGYITQQLTIEQQQELWRRQLEERRRQQLITTGTIQESSLNQSTSYGDGGVVKIGITQQGIYDGDETRLRNGTEHLDQSHYESTADTSSTYASGRPPGKIISKDRGDQPPQHYEEDYDLNETEPGIGNYPSEPQIASQVFQPSTPVSYEPPYVAPLAPLPSIATGNDKLISNQQTTVDVYPGTAGETEVQRSYHRKKTTITQTIPVLLGPGGEVIQGSVSEDAPAALGSQQQIYSNSGRYQASSLGTHQSAAGGYQSLLPGSSQSQRNVDAHVASQLLAREREAQERDAWQQTYQSQSSSQQSGGKDNSYESSVYGSEVEYTGQPDSTRARGNRGRYTSGSSSQSVSFRDGGSYSQASAFGHQQSADRSLEEIGQQLTEQSFEADERQQNQDLSQQFVDDDEETEQVETLRHQRGYQSHRSYSQSTGEMEDLAQKTGGQSISMHQQQRHSSHSEQSSAVSHSSSSGGSYVASAANNSNGEVEPIPSEVQEEEEEMDQNKPGFWKRLGKKAKDLFG